MRGHGICLGIDPGHTGGLATYGAGDGDLVWPMPPTESEIIKAIRAIVEIFGEGIIGVIEKVHSMPRQGVASTFKFGQIYGFLRAALASSGIAWQDVQPKVWQAGLSVPAKATPTERKRHLLECAKRIQPKRQVTLVTADAVLIAHWGWRSLFSRAATENTV